ncbi:MAG: RNA pyrophosphohydrolase [Gammaproteobacteria bacterium]|nr:RNA pyrophosphohydrolase [Gammaproteobacteria bacterium]
MIDSDGYRANVGIILCNQQAQVMWARRIGQDAWQFPQGGIGEDENTDEAMFRELWEETGLKQSDVNLLASTNSWLRYKLPRRFIRKNSSPRCIGQKQKWFLLELLADEKEFNLKASGKPEFDHWKWVDYWHPVENVVFFKRRVYQCALAQLESCLPTVGDFANNGAL